MNTLLTALGVAVQNNVVIWDWDPVLLTIPGINLSLRYYGIMFALALAVGYLFIRWRYKEENEDPEHGNGFSYAIIAGILIGTRLVHCLFYEPEFYLSHPVEILKFWKGGLASHGAALGILVVCMIYSLKYRKEPIRASLDRIASGIPFAAICIRTGNFFNSEIVGKPTDGTWGFVFTRYDAVPRHPSQLYEIGMGIILCIVAHAMYTHYKKANKPLPLGLMSSTMFAGYFFMRFIVEFFKEYQVSELAVQQGLTMGQYLSLPFLILGLIGIWACLWGPWKNQNILQYNQRFQLKSANNAPTDDEEDSDDTNDEESHACKCDGKGGCGGKCKCHKDGDGKCDGKGGCGGKCKCHKDDDGKCDGKGGCGGKCKCHKDEEAPESETDADQPEALAVPTESAEETNDINPNQDVELSSNETHDDNSDDDADSDDGSSSMFQYVIVPSKK